MSDREHGRRTGTSHHTAGTVREELEGGGQIAHHDTRIGADGIVQPADKPKPTAPQPEPKPEPDFDDDLDDDKTDTTAPQPKPLRSHARTSSMTATIL